jgi:polyribonucleotide nucleotidyltransferase
MLGAVMFAHDECKKVVNRSSTLAEKAAKDPWEVAVSDNSAIKDKLKKLIGKDIAAAYKLTDKSERSNALNAARAKAKEAFAKEDAQTQMARQVVKKLEGEIVRGAILKDGSRIDGRTPRRSARSRRWSASCRAPTVRRCSPAAKRRRSAPPRWAPRTASR